MYIASARAQLKKLTHTGVEIDTCEFQTGCQLFSAATGMSLELRFWRDFSGVKHTCWTTGSWRSCLSLEVVSSIPAGSTIIYRFLCGFICVSLCQSIKIKPTNMYIASARAQFKKLTHTGVEIDTCEFQTGCQLFSAATGMSLELRFWRDFSGVKHTCWTTGSWRSCLSLEVVSSIPAGSTIIYRFLCGFICVSLCQSIKIKPTNMYIASARAQFKKLTHTGVEIDTCAFQTGFQLFSAATGMSLELRFWRDFSGVKLTCWTTVSWRSCLSLEVVSSIPAGSTIIYRFLCWFICVSLCQSIKIKPTNMYIASARAQFKKLTHTGVEIDTCAFQTGCQLFSAATGMSLELRFWRDFSGVKRTCWTTGSWRSCLSLEVVSSIPAGSTIIYRFLWGFICVSLCQSIKIKPTNMYIASARAQFTKLTHTGVEIDTCAFQTGCQLFSAATGMSLELRFWRDFSGVKRTCWTTGSWRSCLSLEVVSSIPAGSTIIYRFLCGFICVSLCQSIKIKPTNMYIASARAQLKKLTHTGVEIDTCAFQTGCQLFSAATGMSLELRFWRDFSGVKRTCWTTGSWGSCLSLEVVSSIPAGSTIIYRFLCGFICASLCQSIKIKPTNMYIASTRAQFKKFTHTGVEIDTCAFQTGCLLFSAATGMSLELRFWRDFSGVKRTCWTTGSWRSCLSLEVVSSIPARSTIIYRFLCGFICVSLCQSIKIKPTNMYIASARAQLKKMTHTGVEIDTCAFQTGCQLFSAATGMSLELRFWRDFSGVKRTCWTTGSWRSCLSLEVVSSIPAGSTIIYRFLCGFICVSLCQSIKIKPTNMYIASARAQLKKLTHTGVEIDTCAFQTGCQLFSAATGMSLELRFWRDFSGVKHTCWTTGSWRSCLSLEVVSSIPAGSTIIYRFLCGFICVSLCQSIKIKPTNMYIASARAQFKKLTHTGVEIDTCAFQTGCQLFSAATGMSLELRFWRDFGGVKRTCWTTGSWRSCLSLEVVSSIPAGSTIIYRFLCGFICVFLCQSIKIKPTNMYIASARAQFKKLTHTGVEIDTCAFQTGCRLFSAATGMSLELRFWRDFSGVKRTCWTTGSWRSCLSLEVVSSIPAGSTIIYRFLCGFICVSLCQSIKIKPTNMYIASARAQFKKLTHTGVEIDTCAFQTGCQLFSAATGMSLEFLARFQWREAYVLDNWQLAELPQSGGREFDPRRVHDNLSVPLWVYMRFPVPEHQNQTNKYVYRQRQGAVQKN